MTKTIRWMIAGGLGAILACLSPAAYSQVVVTKGKPLVYVEPLNGPNGASSTRMLQTNFRMSGVLENGPAEKAQYKVTGLVTAGVSKLSFIDTKTGKTLVSHDGSMFWRDAVHSFSDNIVKELTGEPGIATTKVAFISKKTGSKELYVMDLCGEGVKQVSKDNVLSGSPAFSPDGTRVAYTSYKSGYPDVYVVTVANGQRARVASFPGLNSGAAFSPKGDLLALTLSKDGNPEIYFMSSGGGTANRVTRSRGTDASPSWGPDGDSIVYTSDDRGTPQLYIARLAGKGIERLNTGALYATEPNWSPDGKSIAFNSRTGGAFQICVYDVASKQTRQLTSVANNEDPTWCRDSRHLVFSRSGRLVLLDVPTGDTFDIDNGFTDSTEPSCSR